VKKCSQSASVSSGLTSSLPFSSLLFPSLRLAFLLSSHPPPSSLSAPRRITPHERFPSNLQSSPLLPFCLSFPLSNPGLSRNNLPSIYYESVSLGTKQKQVSHIKRHQSERKSSIHSINFSILRLPDSSYIPFPPPDSHHPSLTFCIQRKELASTSTQLSPVSKETRDQ
jgi:hypothetical protein